MASKPGPSDDADDLDSVVAALHDRSGPLPVLRTVTPCERSARSNRRAGLGLALVALLACGVLQLVTATPHDLDGPSGDSRAGVVFANAQSGACLAWPPNAPDKPSFVQCRNDHVFEVAKSVEMSNFGEPCQAAVQQYLGPRYDPNSRFTISVLWAGDAAGRHAEGRRLLCGLELLGADGRPTPFKEQVAAQDQSKVWPAGTCLGFDASTRRSTDLPVDCANAHAVEVTATVSLADRFPGPVPTTPEQDLVLRDECTRLSEAYVHPITVRDTGLRLDFGTVAAASWEAGSRRVSCGLVSPAEQGLNPVVGSVRHTPVGDQAIPPPQAPPPPPEPPSPVASSAPPPRPSSSAPPASPTTTTPTTTASSTATATPSSPATSSSPAPSSASSSPSSASSSPSSTQGPSPTEPSESQAPAPGAFEIPGLGPIALPGAPAAPGG